MVVQKRLVSMFFLCALLAVGFASSLDTTCESNNNAADEKVTANINKIFDSLMPAIQSFILRHELDPLELEDMSANLGILIQKRHLNLTNGWLQGLSEIRRAKDVVLSYQYKVLTLDATLGFEALQANYDYLFKDGLIKREGAMQATVKRVDIRVVIELDFQHYKIGLRTLQIDRIDKVQLKLVGNVIDPVLNAALKGFTTVFRRKITSMIEEKASKILVNTVSKINERIPQPDKVQESDAVFRFVPIPYISLLT